MLYLKINILLVCIILRLLPENFFFFLLVDQPSSAFHYWTNILYVDEKKKTPCGSVCDDHGTSVC